MPVALGAATATATATGGKSRWTPGTPYDWWDAGRRCGTRRRDSAATMAACSGNGGSTSVKFRTLGTFLEGSWEFRAENGSGARIAVSREGDWLMRGGGADPWPREGTWSLDDYAEEGRTRVVTCTRVKTAEAP
ncbi:hypothetical protein ACFY7H_16635 [Streptomyces sp. NPDC012794]|uniref:hypothetical protein n=1 Tax=Streptomyces sp. NPDC012794 TaxID=3364850 RepID=UPI003679C28F